MNEPSRSSAISPPRIDLAKSIRDCVADLERAGFARPASLSPDAYLNAIAELDERWSADARRLSRTYAKLRFGACDEGADFEVESQRDEALLACRRLALAATSESGVEQECVEAWRVRWIEPTDGGETIEMPSSLTDAAEEQSVPAPPVAAAPKIPPKATKSHPARRPSPKDAVPPGGGHFWNVTSLVLAAMIVAGLGGGALGSAGSLQALLPLGAFGSSQIDFSNGPVVMLSPPFRKDGGGKPEVGLPQMFPSHYPHADRFNGTIATSWLELAELFREVGRFDRADAIYNYIARELPRDPSAQIAYASFLLTVSDPLYRNPERALKYAERGYGLDPDCEGAAEILAAALFANGDVARAVSVQQERLSRLPRPDFAGVPVDRFADQGAG